MAKRRSVGDKKRADSGSEDLPQFDQQWLTALIVLARAFRDNHVSYDETPEALQRSLRKLKPDKLFGVIAECLYMLIELRRSPTYMAWLASGEAQRKWRPMLFNAVFARRVVSSVALELVTWLHSLRERLE